MRAVDFIEEKRDGKAHNAADIREFVLSYAAGSIPDYQASAWLMAVYLNGLTDTETFALTNAMVASGETLDLSSLGGVTVDKHSTGGIGDKCTMAVVPLLAAAGVRVAKMSGRGLGFTGGTIDKLESIPGFRVALTVSEIVEQTRRIGACICSQTKGLVPADRKLYALRDVTGTVESLPLIAASVMSKKIASGSQAILLDVKVGRGAFMKDLPTATKLAKLMVAIGNAAGLKVEAVLTSMDVPLGRTVGNWLEVAEIAALLRNEDTDTRLRHEVLELTRRGLALAGVNASPEQLIESGRGWRKLQEIVAAQGGDIGVFGTHPAAPFTERVLSSANGYIADIDALAIGHATVRLGAGREAKDQPIDPLAGIVIEAVVGKRVERGDTLAVLHASTPELLNGARELVAGAFAIEAQPRVEIALILETIP